MATKAQRVKAIVDALTDRDMSVQNITRVVDGMLGLEPSQVALMTTSEKLDRFLLRIRSHILEQVKAYEKKELVKSAEETVNARVETDFAVVP